MKTAQLIKRTEIVMYNKDGVFTSELNEKEKLQIAIFGETKIITTEEIVFSFRGNTKKQIEQYCFNYLTAQNIENTSDYYLIFHAN